MAIKLLNKESLSIVFGYLTDFLDMFKIPYIEEIIESQKKAEMSKDEVKHYTDELDKTMSENHEAYVKIKEAVNIHDKLTEKWMFPYSSPHSIMSNPVAYRSKSLLYFRIGCFPDIDERSVSLTVTGPSQEDEVATDSSNPFFVSLNIIYYKHEGSSTKTEQFSFSIPIG